MKKLSGLIIFLFCALFSYGQIPNNQSISNNQTRYHIPWIKADSGFIISIKDTLNNPSTVYVGSMTIRPQDTLISSTPPLYVSNGHFWYSFLPGDGGGGGGTGTALDSITVNGDSTLYVAWQGGVPKFNFPTLLKHIKAGENFYFTYSGDTTILNAVSTGSVFADTLQWSVLDSISTPRVSPEDGDKFLVGTAPTGAFVGHANQIATYTLIGASYSYQDAVIGDLLYNAANGVTSKWTGTTWVRVPGKLIAHWPDDRYGFAGSVGTNDNFDFGLRQAGVNRATLNSISKDLTLAQGTGLNVYAAGGGQSDRIYWGDIGDAISTLATYSFHENSAGRWQFQNSGNSTAQVRFTETANTFLLPIGTGATVGNINPAAQLDITSTTKGVILPRMSASNRIARGGGIASASITNGGSGYTNGSYTNVPLTTITGSGSTALASITVVGGVVTAVSLNYEGINYQANDMVSSASIGGGGQILGGQ